MVFWLVTDVWVRVGWFGYTFCVGLPRGSRVVPVSAASLRASFGWLFPFLLGGTFIEAYALTGLPYGFALKFPFLLGGTFIEALGLRRLSHHDGHGFPFLLGGTFIEAQQAQSQQLFPAYFPSFWEGLSLRPPRWSWCVTTH